MLLRSINRGCDGLLVAETYQQARQVMVPAIMEAASDLHQRARFMPSEMVIRWPAYGTSSYIRSADKAERIAGFEVGDGWCDEVGRWPDHATEPTRDPWTQVVARISDRRAVQPQVLVTGTHEGRGTRLYRDWCQQPKEGHTLYRGSTRDNAANLEAGYIASLESSYDDVLLEQYLEGGAAEPGVPLAYYAFGSDNLAPVSYSPDWPLYLSCDFNVAPMCWVIAQPQGAPPDAPLHVVGELVQSYSANTGELADQFCDRYSNHLGMVYVFGDASGKARDTRSRIDDYQLLLRQLRVTFGERIAVCVPAANPPVRDRLSRVNALCRDGTGRRRLLVNERACPVLAADLHRVRMRGAEIDKRDLTLTHASDALGYMVHKAYPPYSTSSDRAEVSGRRAAAAPTGQAAAARRQFSTKLTELDPFGTNVPSP